MHRASHSRVKAGATHDCCGLAGFTSRHTAGSIDVAMARSMRASQYGSDQHFYLQSSNSYPQGLSTGKGLLVDNFRHAVLTSTFTSTIDSRAMLQLATRSPKGMAQAARLVLVASLLFILTGAPAYAEAATHKTTSRDYLKLYAHSRIINYEQFKCFDALITRESHWNVAAHNGSHYGLGQMKNAKYRVLDGYTQVDWSIRYIKNRYHSMCNAWRFFKVKGYH